MGQNVAGNVEERVLLPLLLEEKRLLELYGPRHPKVLSVRERIKVAREQLAQHPPAPPPPPIPVQRTYREVPGPTGSTSSPPVQTAPLPLPPIRSQSLEPDATASGTKAKDQSAKAETATSTSRPERIRPVGFSSAGNPIRDSDTANLAAPSPTGVRSKDKDKQPAASASPNTSAQAGASPPRSGGDKSASQPSQEQPRGNSFFDTGYGQLIGIVGAVFLGVLIHLIALVFIMRRYGAHLAQVFRVELVNPTAVGFVGQVSAAGVQTIAADPAIEDVAQSSTAETFDIGPTYAEEMQQKQEAQRQQEEAVLRHIFELNLQVREQLGRLSGARRKGQIGIEIIARKGENKMEQGTTYIGMDLGTFKTSVASSTGVRDVLFSAVGWPKDQIARTMLGRDVVFGKDIIEQRLALNVVRPFEKGVLKFNTHTAAGVPQEKVEKHKEAAKLLVEHAVSLTRPSKGKPIHGVIGAPSRASILNKKVVLEAARSAFDVVMIVSEPFTIAYGMNRLNDTLVIDIGAGTTDLCPIYGTFPNEADQVTVPIGGDVIDEHFFNLLKKAHPEVQLSLNMAREIKEKYGFVHDVNEKALVSLPVDGKPRQFDVTEPLKAACKVIVPPIIQGLRELIARFDPEFQQRMLNNIVLGGGGSQLRGLDRVIEEALKEYGGARVKKVGDAVFAGAAGALKLAMSMPQDCWAQLKKAG